MKFPLILVGLGNPGVSYEHTRHNIGRSLVIECSEFLGLSWSSFAKGKIAWYRHDEGKTAFFYSEDYMNCSGYALQAVCQFYRIPMDQVCVLHDELERPLGTCHIRFGGSARGHNGLRHIDQLLGQHYWRMGFGIDHPKRLGKSISVSDYVLSRFSQEEASVIEGLRARVIQDIDHVVLGHFEHLKKSF